MMEEQIKELAASLRLGAFGAELDDFLLQAVENKWSNIELLYHLLERETELKAENRKRQRVRTAGFPQLLYLNELVRTELPIEAQKALPELEGLGFIKEGRNLVLYGNPGTGKTHISTALGVKACQQGYSVCFTTIPRLLTQIRECRSNRTLRSFEIKFEKYDLVICDEFGYVSCDKEGGELLFNHLSLRAGRKSTIITTNLSFDRWGEIVKDKVLVTAMVDRLTHKARLINMTGESYRLKETKKLLIETEK